MGSSKKNPLPNNMSLEEAGEFWDEHDIFEFGDFPEAKVEFDLRKKRYVGIREEVFRMLESYARDEEVDIESLVEKWITEKIQEASH
jgi:hypothetical protein